MRLAIRGAGLPPPNGFGNYDSSLQVDGLERTFASGQLSSESIWVT